jgi:hypothetical protein
MTPYGYPTECYHCLLDEQPYYLVPPRLYRSDETAPLIVNPLCWFSWHGPIPPDMAARVQSAWSFLPAECILWVDDPATRAVWPYWVGHEFIDYLAPLVPGQAPPFDLPPHIHWVLARAQILVPPDHVAIRRKQWRDTVWLRAVDFERGYAAFSGLIPPFHLGALRRYYRWHIRTGSFQLGDNQVSRRHAAHNEPVARYVLEQLAPAVDDIARTRTKPSYVYLAAYQSGSVLERHTDREQCEYSITLCIDATPEPEAAAPWPITLDTRDGALRIWQCLGDGLLYRGRHLCHYRDELPEGHSSLSLLLHYVDHDFAGPLD